MGVTPPEAKWEGRNAKTNTQRKGYFMGAIYIQRMGIANTHSRNPLAPDLGTVRAKTGPSHNPPYGNLSIRHLTRVALAGLFSSDT